MPRVFPPNPYLNGKATIIGRPTCYECFRPSNQCVCHLVKPFRAHFNTLILQHPHERKKYYSTAKLLTRAVENARILRGIEFDPNLLEIPLAGQKSYLLYPTSKAMDCADVCLDESCTVIVVDGTWNEAGKIVFRNQFLKSLPTLTFKHSLQSQYRIRKQPKAGCLSTLESVGHLLKLNAAVSGNEDLIGSYDSLFEGFERMIDQQLQFWPTRPETQKVLLSAVSGGIHSS